MRISISPIVFYILCSVATPGHRRWLRGETTGILWLVLADAVLLGIEVMMGKPTANLGSFDLCDQAARNFIEVRSLLVKPI